MAKKAATQAEINSIAGRSVNLGKTDQYSPTRSIALANWNNIVISGTFAENQLVNVDAISAANYDFHFLPNNPTTLTLDVGASAASDYRDLVSHKNGAPIGYTVSSNASWLTVPSYTTGNITTLWTANPNSTSRSATITLTLNESGLKMYIYVTQAGMQNYQFYFTENGSTTLTKSIGSNAVNMNVGVTSLLNGSIQGWYVSSNSPEISGILTIPDNLKFTVSPNASASSRTLFITLMLSGSNRTIRLTINQSGSITPSDDRFYFTANGGTTQAKSISASSQSISDGITSVLNGSSAGWTWSSSVSWLTSGNGSGTGNYTVNASQNTYTSSRSGLVTFTQTGSGRMIVLTVTQAAASTPPQDQFIFTATGTSSQTKTVSGAAQSISDRITSIVNGGTVGWSAVSDNPTWLSISAIGSGSYNCSVTENGSTPRTGTITFTQNGTGRIIRLTVNLGGNEPEPDNFVFLFTQNNNVTLNISTGYDATPITRYGVTSTNNGLVIGWTVLGPIPSWISVTNSNGQLAVSVSRNNTELVRNARITLNQTNSGKQITFNMSLAAFINKNVTLSIITATSGSGIFALSDTVPSQSVQPSSLQTFLMDSGRYDVTYNTATGLQINVGNIPGTTKYAKPGDSIHLLRYYGGTGWEIITTFTLTGNDQTLRVNT